MNHTILFTGHMIDEKMRKEKRFPPSKELNVRKAILKLLTEVNTTTTEPLKGVAGGACGGDILFHELCEEIGVKSEIYLAFPAEEFKKHSVSFAGPTWEFRFDRLLKKTPVHIFPCSISYNNIWAATNLWMLDQSLKDQEKHATLIALWDLKGGDGDGGTKHMINMAKNKGIKINIIDINKI